MEALELIPSAEPSNSSNGNGGSGYSWSLWINGWFRTSGQSWESGASGTNQVTQNGGGGGKFHIDEGHASGFCWILFTLIRYISCWRWRWRSHKQIMETLAGHGASPTMVLELQTKFLVVKVMLVINISHLQMDLVLNLGGLRINHGTFCKIR